jgi:diguanylate cyclase (GGDEF)-like protein
VGNPEWVDPRNAFDGRSALFRLYVAAIVLAGAAVVAGCAVAVDWSAVPHVDAALWLVFGLVLLGELRPLFTAGATDANGLLVTNAFLFAVLLRYGLEPAVVLQALVTAIVDLSRRKAFWRSSFNIAQYSLSWLAAGLVVSALGHSASLADPASLRAVDLLAALGGGAAYFVVNEVLVTGALSLKTGESLLEMLQGDLAYEALTNGALLALSPLIAVAMERGVAFVPLLLPPLFAVYQVAAIALQREQEAMCDAMTGLPNRKLLSERTTTALLEKTDGRVALVLFDLDRFKEVNDTLGHHVGDQLLKIVADRLAGAVRDGDTVARLGGDEFAMLLPGVRSIADARDAAQRMAAAIAEPIVLEGVLVDVGASVGVAVSPDHGTELELLLQRADVAMYLAKDAGGGVEVYDAARDRNSTGRLAMLGELRRAISEEQLVLHYQPKASMRDGSVVGVEALVRWEHPELGLVPPDEFIPLAESSGLVRPLTVWVLDEALRQLRVWLDQGLRMGLAVNVSIKDLCGDGLAQRVAAGLVRYDVPPELLRLEVTEGSLFADPVRAVTTLRALDHLGVTLSLDDFGTGYSSLGHLRQLPVHEIKIDRSFVQRMHDDPRDIAIVRSVIDLGLGLGMQVVAEGVETQRDWDGLRAMGCTTAQGWHLSRALPADQLTPWLVERALAVGVPHQLTHG